jgi:hypothetical protein
MEINEAINLWKKNKIQECIITFDCGGDSMGNLEAALHDKKGEDVECKELKEYFEDTVYNRVEFYVNSDGHYQGESGTVDIVLDEDGSDFDYTKNAQAEFSESISSVLGIKLPKEIIEFINDKISNINGGNDGFAKSFKRDFILSDREEGLLDQLEQIIEEKTSSFIPESVDSVEDWYSYTTNSDESEITELTIKEGELQVCINNSYIVYKDSY